MTRSRIAALAAGIAVLLLAVVYLTGGSGRIVRAELADAAGLVPGDEVRVDGVAVGEVAGLRVTPDTHVIATLAITRGLGPLGRDAQAQVRSANLFGGKYLALIPGSRSNPAPASWTIPLARSSAPVEIDDVLDTLDPDTRGWLMTLLNQAGIGVAGRAADLQRLLGALPPTLSGTQQLVANLGSQNRALGRLVDQTDGVIGAFAGQRAQIGRFIATASAASRGFAAEHRALSDTVARAPAALASLQRTLAQLQATAIPLAPAADALRSTAAPLDRALSELPVVERAAGPALHAAVSAGSPLAQLGLQAAPILDRAVPTLSAAATFAAALAPATGVLDAQARPLIGVLQGWARATQQHDALGHYFRGEYVFSSKALLAAIEDPAATAPSSRHRPGSRRIATSPRTAGIRDAPTGSPSKEASLHLPGLPPISLAHLPALPAVKPPLPGSSNGPEHGTKQLSGLLNYLLR